MPIPDYPVDRREAYLSRIAAGEGNIPDYPVTREEAYLDAIANNGGGGGSGGGVLVVHEADMALDKTWQEIHDADFAVVKYTDAAQMSIKLVAMTYGEAEVYSVGVMGIDAGQPYVGYYVTQSADGYPEYYNPDQAES